MTKDEISKNGPKIAWLTSGMSFKTRLGFFLATAGGVGHAPIAPGTAGSFVAAVLFLLVGRWGWSLQLLLILATLGIGLWAAREVERTSGIHDDQRIVIDEVVGLWITLFTFAPTPLWILSGFLIFRVLDIVKPFPANWVDQRIPGARGVIFDDVVSGIYAHLLLRAGERLVNLF